MKLQHDLGEQRLVFCRTKLMKNRYLGVGHQEKQRVGKSYLFRYRFPE